MLSNALASNLDQLCAESVLTPLTPQQSLWATNIATDLQRLEANEERDASKDRASRQKRPKHASGISERSDFHHQGIVGAPAGTSHNDLPPAETGASAGVSCRQQLAFQPRGDRAVGARAGWTRSRKPAAPASRSPPPLEKRHPPFRTDDYQKRRARLTPAAESSRLAPLQ
jgi:hypothetical protein